jgi:hypothetical protein
VIFADAGDDVLVHGVEVVFGERREYDLQKKITRACARRAEI